MTTLLNARIGAALGRVTQRLLLLGALLLSWPAMAAITVTIVQPIESAKVDTTMPAAVTVQSTYEVTSVTGSIAGRTATFVYSASAICNRGSCSPGWTATFDLAGLARGPYSLVVTVRDALGGSGSATRQVTYDALPRINVAAPQPYAVATPAIALDVACIDDDAGCALTARDSANRVLLTGTGQMSGVVSLAPYVGTTATVTIAATDSAAQVVTRTLQIPVVDVSTGLTLQAAVRGQILDVTADRILYFDDTIDPPLLRIRDRVSGTDTTIYAAAASNVDQGFLHPTGALFIDQPGSALTQQLFDWHGGTLTLLSTSYQSTGGVWVKGNYATFFNAGSGYPSAPDYYLRDLLTGTNRLISTGVGNNTNSLAPDGSVAYWKGNPTYEVFLWKNGSSHQVSASGGLWSVYPVTDGTSVVYKRLTPCCTNQTHQIILWSGGQETVLGDLGSADPNPPRSYTIANGTIAYVKLGNSGIQQVWRRRVGGADEQVTIFGTSSSIDTLSDQGAITLFNAGKLYLQQVGANLVELPSGLEKRLWLGAGLYGYVGGAVFAVNLNGLPAIGLQPSALAFGSQAVGSRSAAQDVALVNRGNVAVNLASISVSGDFEQSNTCGVSLAAGESCTISVIFSPTSEGPRSGTVTVTSNSSGSPHTVNLSGTGAPAQPVGILRASPTSLDFGGQSMNTRSLARPVTITNIGAAMVTVTEISASPGFAVVHDCASLAVAASCTAILTFTPTTEGISSGTLLVESSVGTLTVELRGVGERSLVTHYYQSILRRGPDAGGKAYWDGVPGQMQAWGASINETWYAMANYFFFSDEYRGFGRDDPGFITDLYDAFLNRRPDAGGLDFWTSQLGQGIPREVIMVSFMFSPEFAAFTEALFGKTAARPEVDTVMDFYRGLLARLPDNAGFANWIAQFRAAQCAGPDAVRSAVEAISSQFAYSVEYLNRNRTNAQYVGDLYNAFLRRGGEPAGVQFWIDALDSGRQTREALRQAFMASPEFSGRVQQIVAAGCY